MQLLLAVHTVLNDVTSRLFLFNLKVTVNEMLWNEVRTITYSHCRIIINVPKILLWPCVKNS